MRILVVEDDELSNMALMQALEPDHEVFATHEAESADLVVQNQQFDLILLDINLPGMDGIRFSEIVRCDRYNKNTPIVAVSGMDTADVLDKVRDHGFRAFIKKPYSLKALREAIELYGSGTQQSDFRVFA